MRSWPHSADSLPRHPPRLAVPRSAAFAVALAFGFALAGPTSAADPSPSPTPHRPTCAERYPEDGPAGIDLRLGCIARELVGLYAGEPTDEPARISAYLGPLAAVVVGALVVLWLARSVARRTARTLAPVLPGSWWLCDACRSVNGAGIARCYSCGAPWTPTAAVVPTDEHPEMVQRFGGDRKSGGDRPGRSPDDGPA